MAALGESMKKIAHNTGRRMIGKGEEVRFEKEAAKKGKEMSITKEESQSKLFAHRLNLVHKELQLMGGIGGHSEGIKKLDGALTALFSRQELNTFKHAMPGHLPALPVPAISRRDIDAVHNHYASQFDGKVPKFAALYETAGAMRTMEVYIDEFLNRVGGLGDIKSTLLTPGNEAFQALLGNIIIMKNVIAGHEKRFAREIAHQKRVETLKSDSREGLKTLAWKGWLDYAGHLGTAMKAGSKHGPVTGTVIGLAATGWLVARLAGHFAKSGVSALRASASYARYKTA